MDSKSMQPGATPGLSAKEPWSEPQKNIPRKTEKRASLTTHCNGKFFINNSLNSRTTRWLRNKWFVQVCPKCGVPDWKLKKYSPTLLKRDQGSMLTGKNEH
jgi:pyrrolysyl-tRNA synthetase-like protein